VTDLHWELRHAKESFHAASVSLDCDQATMVTQHGKPMFTKVSRDGERVRDILEQKKNVVVNVLRSIMATTLI
jgi:hypothetical protein